MYKIYTKEEIPQRSDEWFAIRENKLTASNADKIATNGTGLKTYCWELVSEALSKEKPEQIQNENILRGVTLEEQAATYCSLITGLNWEEIGFVEVNDFLGCSPDRAIIGEDGKISKILEIKCPNNKNFLELLITDEIPKNYVWQVHFQMLCCELDKATFFSYNQNIYPYYFMKEVNRDEEMIAKLQKGIEDGTKLIKQIKEKYEKIIKGEK